MGAEFRPTPVRPAIDAHPVHCLYIAALALDESPQSIPDTEHRVALINPKSDCGSDGSIHAGSGRTSMQDGKPKVFLDGSGRAGQCPNQRPQDAKRRLKISSPERHCLGIITSCQRIIHGMGTFHTGHEWRADNTVTLHANQTRV